MIFKNEEEIYKSIASAMTKVFSKSLYLEKNPFRFYVIINGVKNYLSEENLKEEFLLHINKYS